VRSAGVSGADLKVGQCGIMEDQPDDARSEHLRGNPADPLQPIDRRVFLGSFRARDRRVE
jgi:hypothetical protein